MRLALVILLLLAGAPAGTAAAATFHDPRGDAGGAPDITTVTALVTRSALRVSIETAAAPAWRGAVARLLIDVDGDARRDITYRVGVDHRRVTREAEGDEHPTTASAELTGSRLTFTVPLAELGGVARIGFSVETQHGDAEDRAPNAITPWPLVLRSTTVRFSPARPAHGRLFTVTGGTDCVARVGGVRLQGACGWLVPRTAKGKVLVVTITVVDLRRTYRLRIV